MLKDDLKMPSDLDGDYGDEEGSEDEGLFPEDNEGSFPAEYGEEAPKKGKKDQDASEDEDGQLEEVFAQANDNKEMDLVENMIA